MTAPELTPEERRRIETILDRLYPESEKQWETHCRVCGAQFFKRNLLPSGVCPHCAEHPGAAGQKRADDPLPHTTSYAQMREDRARLTDKQRDAFIEQLFSLVGVIYIDHDPSDVARRVFNATPEQQAIAMARALEEKVEG